jgi:phosphoribosylformylglycinamidine (FGAM) synthase-like enzyme
MSMVTAGLISGGLSIVSGIFGASAASKRESAARKEKQIAQKKLTFLENNRQEIINPYEGIKDLSGFINNPMANLSVATQAAEIQIEQADISLANTLDTIRSTGASAGGATALAQAALASKKGVSANIEQQEARNEQLKAQGEQQMQQLQMSEQQRLQNADVSGKSFVFNQQEGRDISQLNRLSAQVSGAEAAQMQASSDVTGAITGGIGGAVSTVGSMYSAGAFKPKMGGPKGQFDVFGKNK